jgi:hypothetical protein
VDPLHQLFCGETCLTRLEGRRRDVREANPLTVSVKPLKHPDLAHAERAITVVEDLNIKLVHHDVTCG